MGNKKFKKKKEMKTENYNRKAKLLSEKDIESDLQILHWADKARGS